MSEPAAILHAVDTPALLADAARNNGGEGHGRRLTAAFEALEAFPALAESRDRLLRLVTAERISPGDVVAAVESDLRGSGGQATATGVRVIWTGDHLDAARRLQEMVVVPARAAVDGRPDASRDDAAQPVSSTGQ